MEHITYTIGPGEWICTVTDLQEWFRCRFQHQALSILRFFEEQNYITYSLLGKNRLVKFKISDWPKPGISIQVRKSTLCSIIQDAVPHGTNIRHQ